jgi:hypothetical protein
VTTALALVILATGFDGFMEAICLVLEVVEVVVATFAAFVGFEGVDEPNKLPNNDELSVCLEVLTTVTGFGVDFGCEILDFGVVGVEEIGFDFIGAGGLGGALLI